MSQSPSAGLHVGVTCSGYFFGLDVVRAIERLGYDSFWTGEHFVYHRPIQDVIPVLGAAIGATERIKLGAAVFLAPLYHPTMLAKSCSTLDRLSDGRLIVGVGVGGEYPAEFAACDVPMAGRGARTNEMIEVLRSYWSGSHFSHQGRFFRLDDVQIQPSPVQPGGPPIWIAGRSEAAMRRAARLGAGYLPYLVSPESFATRRGAVERLAEEAGRELPDDFGWALRLELALADEPAAAVRAVARSLSDTFRMDFGEDQAARYALAGPPEVVQERMQAFAAAGVTTFIVQPVSRPGGEIEVLERFAAEVLPAWGRSGTPMQAGGAR